MKEQTRQKRVHLYDFLYMTFKDKQNEYVDRN